MPNNLNQPSPMEQPEKAVLPEQPVSLFYASSNKEMESLEPKRENLKNIKEGQAVFATPDKAYASMFLVPTNQDWAQIVTINGVHCLVIADEKKFKDLDRGGALYSVSAKDFEENKDKRGGFTYSSTQAVKPDSKISVDNGLDTMIENGVQVYFVDKETLKKIKADEKHGRNILIGLESENQKRNKNIKRFDKE